MFAALVESGKMERALDLVERLHLEKSYDLAMQIADRNYKLVDLIESAKERKFARDEEEDDEEAEEDQDEEVDTISPQGRVQSITPEGMTSKSKRAFDDVPEESRFGARRAKRRFGAQ
jgi:chromosome transmission fidelity protein 4